ncbi:MAG: hypothetical protein GTN67_03920 [Hydrotalea flava]|nr:hypothetical protein [Hydrotalea flava]NIN03181.1 hypothetical protein [Hydrotalea flava]NIN14272.1 hypothetical protein [Hydrotalea flava]NIO93359.1 hypothetical protein [Hydrotalea flava]NIQ50347.1 hypothetical protein [Hydrotalea flava]
MMHEKKILHQQWKSAWQQHYFKSKLISGVLLLIILLVILPFYFQNIENRDGFQLNDWLVNHFAPMNVSTPIFIIIWIMAGMLIRNALIDPNIFILFLWSFIFLTISRLLTIYFVPLNPPNDLIPLVDPISNRFYGGGFVTKDLFYSGHTSTQFLMFLCFKNKNLKLAALLSTIAIGILVLIQHIHYTIDVISAPLFAYAVFVIAKAWVAPAVSYPHAA